MATKQKTAAAKDVLCAIRIAHRQQGSASVRTTEAYLVGNEGTRSRSAKLRIRNVFRHLKSTGRAVQISPNAIGLTDAGFDFLRGLSCVRG